MPAKRVLISIDEQLLDRLDRAAVRGGLTRSGLIASLASQWLEPRHGPGADADVRAALASIDDLAAEATS